MFSTIFSYSLFLGMPSPQFNKKVSLYRWYHLAYQSNNLLNTEQHGRVKQLIAEILVENFNLSQIHSYIHGAIVFAIKTDDATETLDELITELKTPLAEHTPKLLFSISLIAKNTATNKNYMYIDGSDDLDTNFLKSIDEFYPKKKK